MSEFFTLLSLKPPGQQLGSRLHLLHLLLLLLLAQQTHNWRSWGSWLWKCMLVKSSFSFNCICCRFSLFTTWDWECFVIKWWGLGCPAPLHGPGIVPWNQPNWYSILNIQYLYQIELGELGSHLGEDWEEPVCIEVSTPQVELLPMSKRILQESGF